jgi:transcriptional regulator with XRE-family HTH domain
MPEGAAIRDGRRRSVDENGADGVPGVSSMTLGEVLAGLRRRRGLTGEALGERTWMSQSKVSKIEQGRVRPSVGDVERIAKALDAPEETLTSLLAEAGRIQSSPRRQTSGRPVSELQGHGQQQFVDREAQASRLRNFEVMTIPGLLQISEYARRVLNSFFEFATGDAEPLYYETAKAVSVRTQRQELLYDGDRTFEFVVMESVLSSPLLTPGYMLAQIDRLEFAAQQSNIDIRIIPNGAELRFPAGNGFTLLDDDAVLAEVGFTPVYLFDESNVAFHRRLFEYFSEIAESNIAPILARYKTFYADEARPKE